MHYSYQSLSIDGRPGLANNRGSGIRGKWVGGVNQEQPYPIGEILAVCDI